MRYRIIALTASLFAAFTVNAAILYVEVPKPYTKKDYVAAVTDPDKFGALYADMFARMDADVKAQMKAINNPAADFIVFATKNGEILRPDADAFFSGEKETVTEPEITYIRDTGWKDDEWNQYIRPHLDRAYPVIKTFIARPYFQSPYASD